MTPTQSEVFNLKDYKEAKTVLPHINAVLKIINLSMMGLKMFKTYIPVAVILSTMNEQKVILEIYQQRYKKILDKKGKRT